jgi:hypothetical protein
MIIPAAVIDYSDRILSAVIPSAFDQEVQIMVKRCVDHHSGYGRLRLDPPAKPRTAGPKKKNADDPVYQSNMLHGFLSQLAVHFGMTMMEIKVAMKADVAEWPIEFVVTRTGRRLIRMTSEADVSTAVEARAIDWCIMIAAEEGLVLKTWEKEKK